MNAPLPEAWLRGPVTGVPAMLQPAAHALLQGQEELHRAAGTLPPAALWLRPGGVAAVGFHVRHAAGVIDRLLTYARGAALSDAQRAALAGEQSPGDDAATLLAALDLAVARAIDAYRATDPSTLGDARAVGRAGLPSTVMGLLFHIAEHVQRHAGQAGTTAAVARALYVVAPPTVADELRDLGRVRALHDAYARRDLATVAAMHAPAAEIVHSPVLPWGGVYRGPDGVQAADAAVAAHVDASFVAERLVPAGGRAVASGRLRGTVRARHAGDAGGTTFDVAAVHVWTLADGHVVRDEVYVDTAALLGALGRQR
jgi:ketosteroid isomerase-like protein